MGCCQSRVETLPKNKDALDKALLVFHSKGMPRDKYTTIKILGKGGFGTVTLVEDKRTGAKRALKELHKSGLSKDDEQTMLREVTTLSQIDHPHIMKVFELIESATSYNIITELIEGGELLEKITKEKKLSEKLAAKFMFETMSAIFYCHSKGIVHRDLKPQNLLLTSKGPDASIKVIDFGIADKLNSRGKITEVIGTPLFMSPEMFDGNYNEKCDIWSSGVILFMMITGNVPFSGNGIAMIKEAIKAAKIDYTRPVWNSVSADVQDLIKKMLDPNPSKRFSAEQVLNHQWFASYKAGSLSDNPISEEAFTNLSKFHATNKLQKSILTFISTSIMDEDSNKQLTKLFKSIDKNNDGRLSHEEIINGYKELGLPASQAEEIIKKVDSDMSGIIEYSEFITATQDWRNICEKDVLEKAFKTYDIGGDGNLSLQELKMLIPGIESSEWEQFINDADKNRDGLISLAEFKEYMLSKLGD
ncbi:hypothetical protein SteCoe_37214 [Stentor coeruleus]|uniref:non-specific serine/threonine protein kinase n=1 Tax=Stentor coeruleus TaxID=5963 RepID=A0A1R2ANI1_9CILI|nr:hypothetical protein SteCoe_37214 [Stentor coeruleus]